MHFSIPFTILLSFLMFVASKKIGRVQINDQHNIDPIGKFPMCLGDYN
jgi:hypothetical protein